MEPPGNAQQPPSPQNEWPGPDDPGVETLHPQGGVRPYAVFLLVRTPFLLMAFFIGFVVGGVPLFSITGPIGAVLTGLAAALIYAGALVWAYRRIRSVTVLVSPVGVETRELYGYRVRLHWQHLTGIGRVDQGTAGQSGLLKAAEWATEGISSLGRRLHPKDALIGWGQRVEPSKLTRRMEQVLNSQRRDPQTGLYEIPVAFNAAGRVDHRNRLLAYARHYRPDLFAPPNPAQPGS